MDTTARDYIGDYFVAMSSGTPQRLRWQIMQISPVVYLCETDEYALAVEIVNRLDATGETPVGSDEDAA